MIGKYLNDYENKPPVPPGWTEWHATAPYDQRVYSYPINNNGILPNYGQDPTDFKQDVLTRKAIGLREPPRAEHAAVLPLAHLHRSPQRRPAHPNPPQNCRGRRQAGAADAHAFDNEPLPKPPNFNEEDVSDKPKSIQNLPRLSPDDISTSSASIAASSSRCSRSTSVSRRWSTP